ncbi:hypothetical protein [Bacillus sp. JCM 19034]|uniref:hypothetical protein n=1 Tax=Bacillus sp. JCM 19034 TaxID=1481928 RepID=UPI0007810F17|nr:hypothetical protein [Bacillus sp. JCM 19034]
MDDMLILNRQNTMVYFDEDKSIIKTYHKEVSIATSQEQYELLIDILSTCKSEVLISDLLKVYEDRTIVMKLIKVLYKTGSVFIYPTSYYLSCYFKKSWFRVLSQYLPANKDILHSCRLVDEAVVHITPEAEQKLPLLRGLLKDNDLKTYKEWDGELTNNDWVISTNEEFEHQNHIVLALSEERLAGVQKYERIERDIPSSDNKNTISRESLLYKVAPYYTMLYLIKSIVGISKVAFSVNKAGKFYEYDLMEDNYMETVDDFSFPTPVIAKGSLDYVGHFESFISAASNIPLTVSGWKNDSYTDLFQIGYATYSLTNQVTKETFVYAGLDYIDTAMESIKKGLAYYLNKESTHMDWLVSTRESYYLDKVLLLLEYIDEPFLIYKLKNEVFLTGKFNEYLNVASFKPEFCVKKYLNSNSYTVYLYDRENDQLYTDGKRTIRLADKGAELAINYLLVTLNPEKTMTTILKPVNAEEKKEIFQMISGDMANFEEIIEKDFIENGLTLFKHARLSPNESAWKYEEKLNESNLIVRELEVRTYQETIV